MDAVVNQEVNIKEVIEAAKNLIAAVSDFIHKVVELCRNVFNKLSSTIREYEKMKKKLYCNNWRRMHGMKMLHRKRRRQGHLHNIRILR